VAFVRKLLKAAMFVSHCGGRSDREGNRLLQDRVRNFTLLSIICVTLII